MLATKINYKIKTRQSNNTLKWSLLQSANVKNKVAKNKQRLKSSTQTTLKSKVLTNNRLQRTQENIFIFIYLYQDKIKHRVKRDNVLVEVRNRTLRGNFSFRRNFLVPVVPVVVVPASRLVVVAPVLPAALVAVRVVAVPVARREPLVRLFSFNYILFNCIELFFFFSN